ncbi:unnamed protein product [Rotaria sp. Silwood1]|nr:unnamed protein product [Rotaria sp. Silwood1]
MISQPNLTLNQQRDLILQHNLRFLVMVRFESGIADRTTHLIASYLIAVLTRRFYVFDDTWPEFFEIMRANLAFRPEIIAPWISHLKNLNKKLSHNHSLYLSNVWQITREHRCHTDFDYEKLFPERILFLKSHAGNVMQMLTSSTSVYAYFMQNILKMRPDNIFGCLYHMLLIPRLSTFIEASSVESRTDAVLFQKSLETLLSPKLPTVGIQIRIGDLFMKEDSSVDTNDPSLIERFGGFFTCVEDLSASNPETIVFLMADSLRIRKIALNRWYSGSVNHTHIQLLTSTTQVKHITYSKDIYIGFRDGLLDMFLYSLCDQHILTRDSGFGRVPAFASMKNRLLFSLTEKAKPKCALGEGQVSFTQSGREWSGV